MQAMAVRAADGTVNVALTPQAASTVALALHYYAALRDDDSAQYQAVGSFGAAGNAQADASAAAFIAGEIDKAQSLASDPVPATFGGAEL